MISRLKMEKHGMYHGGYCYSASRVTVLGVVVKCGLIMGSFIAIGVAVCVL
ncbi:MAG: hypothetical protein ACRC92_26295 [Peptostreptococcaceae bacterium]